MKETMRTKKLIKNRIIQKKKQSKPGMVGGGRSHSKATQISLRLDGTSHHALRLSASNISVNR